MAVELRPAIRLAALLLAAFSVLVGAPTAVAAPTAHLEVSTAGGDPFGQLDAVTTEPGRVSVRGWALDPDTPSAVIVQMYVDGTQNRLAWANESRPDIGAAFAWAGEDHGYGMAMTVPGGAHRVCVYAINVGAGTSRELGCAAVTVPGPDPLGRVDAVTTAPGRVVARGWAVDPDTTSSALVQMYVDWSANVLARTGGPRPDVARALPWAGESRGFEIALDVPEGPHTVCVYAINAGPGASRELGCSRVVVPGHDPFGNVEDVTVEGGRVTASGWALDPDSGSPIIVQMFADSGEHAMTWASGTRTDVGAAYPWAGADHGFAVSLDLATGAHRVCLYGVNVGAGTSREIGCRWVSGPPFFVYGSLRSGQSGYHLLAGRTVGQTVTRMPGLDLYRRSGSSYPYAVPDAANATGIVGEVMQLHPSLYSATVASLDLYERYDPALPPDNQVYVRELRATREGLPSWVYVAGPRQSQYLRSAGILVSSGDFLRW